MSNEDGFRLRTVSIFVFLGFIMTVGMIVTTIINPAGGQLHEVHHIQDIIDELTNATQYDLTIRLSSLVLDNFFIIGYIAVFYGLFLLTIKQDAFFPRIGFALGFTTGICDLIENAIQGALFTGVPNGWMPDSNVFSVLWSFTFIKDISSYMAGFIFVVLLITNLHNPAKLKLHKILFAIFLGLYVSLGSLAIIEPSFLLLRSLSFVVDMFMASVLFYNADKILNE